MAHDIPDHACLFYRIDGRWCCRVGCIDDLNHSEEAWGDSPIEAAKNLNKKHYYLAVVQFIQDSIKHWRQSCPQLQNRSN